ncbi:hypothetical protein ACWEN3_38295 [Streptomyces sp. NPDC004561]
MAHAAPAPGGRAAALTGQPPPDVFSERAHRIGRWAVPAVIGLVYGYWAAANARYGGPITGWNLLFGFVTAFVFFAAYWLLETFGKRMRREIRATLWGAFTAIAIGFLYSLSGHGHTWQASTVLGLVIGVPTGLWMFYRYYTHEDATGHRVT